MAGPPFITDLATTPMTPLGTDGTKFADDELRNIKAAIKNTFPNFHTGGIAQQVFYGPVSLGYMYEFLTANATDLLYKGPVDINDPSNIMAITKDKIIYCRAPRPVFGSIAWFELDEAAMELLFPDTFKLCNGQSVSNTVYNDLIDVPIAGLPDLQNRFLRGSETFPLDPEDSYIDETIAMDGDSLKIGFNAEDLVFDNDTHVHENNGMVIMSGGKTFNRQPTYTIFEQPTYVDQKNTHDTDAMPLENIHTHPMDSNPVYAKGVDLVKDGGEQRIRPAFYNLYPYTRVN